MEVFAIALFQPNSLVTESIQTSFPKHYEYNQTLYFVQADDLAETVAIKVGIKGDARVENSSGFVIKLQEFSYSGYTRRSLWDWLKDAEK